ncbi:metallophosphoesterase [Oryzihumus leptocrescens]|uniref:Putative MPP superfamily phosphohydrolase n=1 Tax=Oryzihumus leptocrescens TaxID=297536 RepID=A0A542Z9X6_9MICO|nr:metallophosphoesterase [Oryzihumus leptocrescens]TQL57101.1 putative MPP superfamily phosphohydrolase [Oryzihumus leptocrescens]
MNGLTRTALGALAVGATGLGYASLIERNAFTLRRYTVPVLPHGAAPLRVLHLSDLHLVPRQRRKIEWVRGLAALEPDLVVNTGDNLADLEAVPAAVRAMEPLLELPGVFVLGSNDYFAPSPKNPARYLTNGYRKGLGGQPLPTSDLVDAFAKAGWVDLTNARAALEVAGHDLDFVGVDDPHLNYDRYPGRSELETPSGELTIGVTHAPYTRVLDEMTSDGAGLVIAGHTHGGQLCVPFYGALVTNCDLDRKRAKGVSRWWPGAGSLPSSAAPADAAWMEVSAGLGTSPYAPVRFACRPEATLLTLVAKGS